MRPRIVEELALLRETYPDVQHLEAGGQDWFLLPAYPFPEGWRVNDQPINTAPVCFPVNAAYPGTNPYSFSTPAGISFEGRLPTNSEATAAPPFAGAWHQFSWQPEQWLPTADVRRGANLLVWTRGFRARLKEGA